MWVSIHKCMEAMLGISLYSYLNLKLAKQYVFLNFSYVFSSNKIGEEGGTGSAWKLWGSMREVAQTMYTHVSKCKNDKIKERKKKKRKRMKQKTLF
jgi:hypothetical protein